MIRGSGFLKLFMVVIISFCTSCRTNKIIGNNKSTSTELRFLGEYIIPYGKQFKNTTIGGLSGIDYDIKNKIYYLISDDWSQTNPARFYTARILLSEKGIDSIAFSNVHYFLQRDGKIYPNAKQDPYHTPDPEAIRYNPLKENLVWNSEGERFITKDSIVLQDPAIRIVSKEGNYIDSFPLPLQMHMYIQEKGLRRNGVFEGLSFADNYASLYVSVEEPIYEDGPRAGTGDSTAWIRVLKYNADKKNLAGQYAYQVDPVVRMPVPANGHKINGVSDILEWDKNKLIFIERSYSLGRTDCNVRVYIGDISGATNIADITSLKEQNVFKPIKKTLLLNMDSLGMYIGNIEGVSFGPVLSNGHRTLMFVADNNFRATEKTQFLLFEVVPK
jgi:hypothetical protein